MKKKILAVVDAPGPAEFIAPVIPLLKKHINLKILTVKKSPTHVLKRFHPLRADTAARAIASYRKLKPDLLVVGMSSLERGPFIVPALVNRAVRDGMRIIAFQDFWANHRKRVNESILKHAEVILTPDRLAAKLIREDNYHGKIIITGHPAFEQLSHTKVARERLHIRNKLRIPDDAYAILYAGTGTPQSFPADEITFRFFAAAFEKFRRKNACAVLLVHPHPRDEHPSRYRELAPRLPTMNIAPFTLAEEILPAADAVVSMYSTTLLHACLLRIPAVSILLKNAGWRRLQTVNLDDFPPNARGAVIGIYQRSTSKLAGVFQKIYASPSYRKKIRARQKRFFPPVRGAVRRAARVILDNL